MTSYPPTADELRAAFDAPSEPTVGLEEELMLLDPESRELVPRAPEVLAAVHGDDRFKLELPASQLEIMVRPRGSVREAMSELAGARRDLSRATEEVAHPAAAGVHPLAAPEGELNSGERYDRTLREYASVARRQLICALQVHVAVRGADRALATYNALRCHLPDLAALAANAPFHAGRDTGLASVRPTIAETLPRQGVPPALHTWEDYADALRWGHAAGAVPEARLWWWELRLHPIFGTLELRVPDAQSTLAEAAAVAAFAQSLAVWLSERHASGEELPTAATWRIEENRWSAARHGVEGAMADLRTGERQETRARLHALAETLAPTARTLGCEAELELAAALVERNGAIRQRAAATELGVRGLPGWLAARYLAEVDRWAPAETGAADPIRGQAEG